MKAVTGSSWLNEMVGEGKMKTDKIKGLPIRLILGVMGIFSLLPISRKIRLLHFSVNSLAWESFMGGIVRENGKEAYIDDQSRMNGFIYGRESKRLSRLFLGGRPLTGCENTCEVIAVYNALLSVSKRADKDASDSAAGMAIPFPALLSAFEKKGISFGGYFGTSFGAVVRFLKKRELPMHVFKGKGIKRDVLDSLEKKPVESKAEADSCEKGACDDIGHEEKRDISNSADTENVRFRWNTCIMMTENTAGNIRDMVHTVCITRETGEDAQWKIHNDYEGCKSYASLSDAVFGYHKGKGRPLGVILLP